MMEWFTNERDMNHNELHNSKQLRDDIVIDQNSLRISDNLIYSMQKKQHQIEVSIYSCLKHPM